MQLLSKAEVQERCALVSPGMPGRAEVWVAPVQGVPDIGVGRAGLALQAEHSGQAAGAGHGLHAGSAAARGRRAIGLAAMLSAQRSRRRLW